MIDQYDFMLYLTYFEVTNEQEEINTYRCNET